MKAVILNGALTGDNSLQCIQKELITHLEKTGSEVSTIILCERQIAHCIGCFNCWVRTPGICKSSGEGEHIAKWVIQSDLAIFLTPLTFGGYSSELKKAIDHLICLISPFFLKLNGETHHQKRYTKYPNILGVAVAKKKATDSAEIFSRLLERNAINLHAPAHCAVVIDAETTSNETEQKLMAALKTVGVRT